MFSMSATGIAKTLVAVTISMHPAAAHHSGHDQYRVRQGDTLSNIARHEYGKASDWPALWWANRHQVPNPGLITAGQRLRLPNNHHVKAWLTRVAACAARVSHAFTWWLLGSRSRWPAVIRPGLGTSWRFAHHTAGQSDA